MKIFKYFIVLYSGLFAYSAHPNALLFATYYLLANKKETDKFTEIKSEILDANPKAQELAQKKYEILMKKLNESSVSTVCVDDSNRETIKKEIQELKEYSTEVAEQALQANNNYVKNILIGSSEMVVGVPVALMCLFFKEAAEVEIGWSPNANLGAVAFAGAGVVSGCLVYDGFQRVRTTHKITKKDYLKNVESNREFFQKLIVESRQQQEDSSEPSFFNS